jgi:hypothetical protein
MAKLTDLASVVESFQAELVLAGAIATGKVAMIRPESNP